MGLLETLFDIIAVLEWLCIAIPHVSRRMRSAGVLVIFDGNYGDVPLTRIAECIVRSKLISLGTDERHISIASGGYRGTRWPQKEVKMIIAIQGTGGTMSIDERGHTYADISMHIVPMAFENNVEAALWMDETCRRIEQVLRRRWKRSEGHIGEHLLNANYSGVVSVSREQR